MSYTRAFSDEEGMNNPLPRRHSSELGTVSIDILPGQLATACVDVDLGETNPWLALPDPSNDKEEDNNRHGEVGLEEAFSIVNIGSCCGADGDVELERGISN
jgi:hypothetical protein